MINDFIINQVDKNGVYSENKHYYVNASYFNNDALFKSNINLLFEMMLKCYYNPHNLRVIDNRSRTYT